MLEECGPAKANDTFRAAGALPLRSLLGVSRGCSSNLKIPRIYYSTVLSVL